MKRSSLSDKSQINPIFPSSHPTNSAYLLVEIRFPQPINPRGTLQKVCQKYGRPKNSAYHGHGMSERQQTQTLRATLHVTELGTNSMGQRVPACLGSWSRPAYRRRESTWAYDSTTRWFGVWRRLTLFFENAVIAGTYCPDKNKLPDSTVNLHAHNTRGDAKKRFQWIHCTTNENKNS